MYTLIHNVAQLKGDENEGWGQVKNENEFSCNSLKTLRESEPEGISKKQNDDSDRLHEHIAKVISHSQRSGDLRLNQLNDTTQQM